MSLSLFSWSKWVERKTREACPQPQALVSLVCVILKIESYGWVNQQSGSWLAFIQGMDIHILSVLGWL